MFYSHQLLARKAPLGQIWMAATMHAKINRKGLNKLNIIKICEEILNPSVPMALRLSGILMGGIVIVYERKVKLLYDDVTRLLLEINSAWRVRTVADPTILPKGKSKAKKEFITLPENEETNVGDMEQSVNPMEFLQHDAYITMRLDSVDEPYISNEAKEQDASQPLHQADVENITLSERFESFQANADPHYRFERFDIEGDETTQVNFTYGDTTQIPTLIPSPPHQVDPTGDIIQDQHPGSQVNQQSDQRMEERQEKRRRGLMKRKRRQPVRNAMDYEQTIIPVHLYQSWLQNASDIVSRGRKRKRSDITSRRKTANLMELPPVVLIGNLFTSGNRDVYYPSPILELWYKSTQPSQESPSERTSIPQPPEPSFSSPPGLHQDDFVGIPVVDFHSGSDGLLTSKERFRDNVLGTGNFMDELRANLDNGSRAPKAATPKVASRNSGDSADCFPRSVSEHGPLSEYGPASDHGLSSDSELFMGSFRKKRHSSLEPVAENANFKFAGLSDCGLTPDPELLVETVRTQTQVQVNIKNALDNMTDSIRTHIKAHFDTPGAPQIESLHVLAAGMTRKSAALLFYQTCVLASRDALRVEQSMPYGEILISRGSKL
ncbi:sister chromatid cohesion 1 protein 1 [Prosopis cineraria]|uniref:sister chromatid cohesion 1 protein 1 n=1 Tax=Prosopis cineraria TaxID=364024 RepID=UPI002410B651|nr:sister chromatid cohesion 1 protein 1 [Prosopis cineraria]